MPRLIRADGKALADLVRQFEGEAQQVQKLRTSLNDHLRILRGGGWIADAANRFYLDVDEQSLARLARLQAALEAAARALEAIAKLFQLAEQDGADSVRGVQPDYGGTGRSGGFNGGGGANGAFAGSSSSFNSASAVNASTAGPNTNVSTNSAGRGGGGAAAVAGNNTSAPNLNDALDENAVLRRRNFFAADGEQQS